MANKYIYIYINLNIRFEENNFLKSLFTQIRCFKSKTTAENQKCQYKPIQIRLNDYLAP